MQRTLVTTLILTAFLLSINIPLGVAQVTGDTSMTIPNDYVMPSTTTTTSTTYYTTSSTTTTQTSTTPTTTTTTTSTTTRTTTMISTTTTTTLPLTCQQKCQGEGYNIYTCCPELNACPGYTLTSLSSADQWCTNNIQGTLFCECMRTAATTSTSSTTTTPQVTCPVKCASEGYGGYQCCTGMHSCPGYSYTIVSSADQWCLNTNAGLFCLCADSTTATTTTPTTIQPTTTEPTATEDKATTTTTAPNPKADEASTSSTTFTLPPHIQFTDTTAPKQTNPERQTRKTSDRGLESDITPTTTPKTVAEPVKIDLNLGDTVYVEPGGTLDIEGTVTSNTMISRLDFSLKTPDGFTVTGLSNRVDITEELTGDVGGMIKTDENISAGEYMVNATLRDRNGLLKASRGVRVVVVEGLILPIVNARLPPIEVIQERLFSMSRKTFITLYRNRILLGVLALTVATLAYAYHRHRKRAQTGGI